MRLYSEVSWLSPRHVYDGLHSVDEYGPGGTSLARTVYGPGVDEPLLAYVAPGSGDRLYNSAIPGAQYLISSRGVGDGSARAAARQ